MREVLDKDISDIEGVFCTGIDCGIKESGGLDLALIYVPSAVAAAGVFTKNAFSAACIKHNKASLANGQVFKAIVINSGNANAVTGEAGVKNVKRTASFTAEALGISSQEVAVASTGIIGKQLPMDKLEKGLTEIFKNPEVKDGKKAAQAILTTDTRTKSCFYEQEIAGNQISIAGIAKGSGMIAPNMATMLGFITCSAAVDQAHLQEILAEVVDETFNMISVDTDTSTSDMVLCVAGGQSELNLNDANTRAQFRELLFAVCKDLALKIVLDGEGASRLIEVKIMEAPDRNMAKELAKSIIDSPLVKTAIHGADPNWGRIIMALGKVEPVVFDAEKVSVTFQDTLVFANGSPVEIDRAELAKRMNVPLVNIGISLASGAENATAWGCDLTKGYIDINTCYN